MMTGASEQGRSGILWTIFEGEPFCSRRVASFSDAAEAWEYLTWKNNKTMPTQENIQHIAEIEKALADHNLKTVNPDTKPELNPHYVEGSAPPEAKAKDAEILQTKAIRIKVDAILQDVKAMPSSREIALCRTKLEEAVMWAGMNLKRLADGQTCYPNSYQMNTTVDPMKDGIKL